MWRSKSGSSGDVPEGANEIESELSPGNNDVLVPKHKPSLFHDMLLLVLLI